MFYLSYGAFSLFWEVWIFQFQLELDNRTAKVGTGSQILRAHFKMAATMKNSRPVF